MKFLDAEPVRRSLHFPSLIERLAEAFPGDVETPVGHHYTLSGDWGLSRTLTNLARADDQSTFNQSATGRPSQIQAI